MGSLDELSSGKEQERVPLPNRTIKWGGITVMVLGDVI